MVNPDPNQLMLAFVAVAFGTLALFLARESLLDRRRWRNLRAKLELCLRKRPNRIIVGEVRGAELETMTSMANLNLPERAMRNQIASAIQVIVHVARLLDGKRKVVNVSEIVGMVADVISLQNIFVFGRMGVGADGTVRGELHPTGIRPPPFAGRLERYGLDLSGLLLTESLDKRVNGGDHTW